MKTIILLVTSAVLGGCVTHPERPQKEGIVIAPRENLYRDAGYDEHEARLAAQRDAWRDQKEVRPLVIPKDYISAKHALLEQ